MGEKAKASEEAKKNKPSAASIFGSAKPVDTTQREREVEEKLSKLSTADVDANKSEDNQSRAYKPPARRDDRGYDRRDDRDRRDERGYDRREDRIEIGEQIIGGPMIEEMIIVVMREEMTEGAMTEEMTEAPLLLTGIEMSDQWKKMTDGGPQNPLLKNMKNPNQ